MKTALKSIFLALLLTFSVRTSGETFERPLVFGVNSVAEYGLFQSSKSFTDSVWERMREIGCRSTRMAASWAEIEVERGKRDWTEMDDLVNRAVSIGIEPILLVVNTPAWASPTGLREHGYPPREDVAHEFEGFCEELAVRYRGQVRLFEFWNEQNGGGWHVTRGFNRADEYIPWMRRAYHALKRGNPECRVALGGLDDAEGNAPIFLRLFYRFRDEWYPGEDFIDAVATHPYSPDARIMIRKLEALLEIMRENGDGEKPLWITEYGWHTGHDTLWQQAEKLQEFLNAFTSPDLSYLEIATYLSIGDFENRHLGFGLCDSNLRPRPAFLVFRDHPMAEFPFHHAREVLPVRSGCVNIRWKTRRPVSATVRIGEREFPARSSTDGLEHEAEVSGMEPLTRDIYVLEGKNPAGDVLRSATDLLLVPGPGVFNGDFENGFDAGVARGWRIVNEDGDPGEAFAFDSKTQEINIRRSGSHAQILQARHYYGQRIASTLIGKGIVEPGKDYTLSGWVCSLVHATQEGATWRHLGVDPRGGEDPQGESVLWSGRGRRPMPSMKWDEMSVDFTAESSVVTIFLSIDIASPALQGEYWTYIDDVTLRETVSADDVVGQSQAEEEVR